MKRFPLWVGPLLTVPFLALACSSKHSAGPPPATGGTGGDHAQNGSPEGVRPPFPYVLAGGKANAGTNHHFEARPHEPHFPPQGAVIASPQSVPPFIDGSARCFRTPVVRSPYYTPTPRPTPVPYGPHTYGQRGSGYGSGSSSPRPTAKSSGAGDRRPLAESPYSTSPSAAPGDRSAEARPRLRAEEGSSNSTGRTWDADSSSRKHYVDEPPAPQREGGFGQAVYLSNDDTMSLSSAQRLIYAIDQYAPLTSAEVRPHELLNYFSFVTNPVAADHDFSVLPTISPSEDEPNKWVLGLAVQGRPLSLKTRRNANLSFVVDRSGSMSAEGRMDYVKQGLLRSLSELKYGDIVNITLFDTGVCQLAQNFVVGRDSTQQLSSLIQRIRPEGSTNLHAGLETGYEAANRVYQPSYTNRVVLVTDALTNTGVTDERLISLVAKHYDERQIRLSGVGVGSTFNDSLLDELTERGKGAYVFLGSSAEVDAVFGPRFVSLIETIAHDVHFKLHLPPSLRMDTFYGEEASTVKERVQAIHYFANTSQMFLSDLQTRENAFPGSDDIMLTIEYQDAETGQARVEEFAWNLGDIFGRHPNVDKAMLVSTFARRLQQIADRPVPYGHGHTARSWNDGEAAQICHTTQAQLARLASPLGGDAEASRVVSLWDRFCGRYQPVEVAVHEPNPSYPDREEPLRPLRTNEFAPRDAWPSAVR